MNTPNGMIRVITTIARPDATIQTRTLKPIPSGVGLFQNERSTPKMDNKNVAKYSTKIPAVAAKTTRNAADSVRDLTPKSGYGVGARWKSPVGPINVDLAYGHAVQKYRVHFSLGFTF